MHTIEYNEEIKEYDVFDSSGSLVDSFRYWLDAYAFMLNKDEEYLLGGGE